MLDEKEKAKRARKALEYYVKREGMRERAPDGEEDGRLNAILDRLAQDVVALANWYSESAAWMRFACESKPPSWALPFLTEEEQKGLGPQLIPAVERPEQAAETPAEKGTTRGRKAGARKGTREPPLPLELVEAMIEMYDDLPFIDPETGEPVGLVGYIDE